MELEITWNRVVRVWWSYLWRNLVAVVAAMIVGGILGFIVGLAMGMMGFSIQAIRLVVTPLSFIAGLLMSVVPMWMILGKDFGEFRLVLLAKQTPAVASSTTPQAMR